LSLIFGRPRAPRALISRWAPRAARSTTPRLRVVLRHTQEGAQPSIHAKTAVSSSRRVGQDRRRVVQPPPLHSTLGYTSPVDYREQNSRAARCWPRRFAARTRVRDDQEGCVDQPQRVHRNESGPLATAAGCCSANVVSVGAPRHGPPRKARPSLPRRRRRNRYSRLESAQPLLLQQGRGLVTERQAVSAHYSRSTNTNPMTDVRRVQRDRPELRAVRHFHPGLDSGYLRA
jgi:hypothetical protein